MSEKLTFVVETRLPLGDEILVTEVNAEIGGEHLEDLRNRLAAMPDVVREARKNIASRFVEFEAYSNDSAYLDALDKVADGVEIVSIKEKMPEGGELMRIYFEAEYDSGGVFGEDAWGVNKEDAVFQGAWSMAVQNGSDGKGENVQDLLDEMDVEVLMEYAKPVTEEELIALLGKLTKAAATGEGVDEIVAEAKAALKAIANNGEMQDWQAVAIDVLDAMEPSASAPRM